MQNRNIDEDPPLLMASWHIGKGAQHMRLDGDENFESPEFEALNKFWQEEASLALTEENCRKLLTLARAVPGFPVDRLEKAQKELDRLNTVETSTPQS